ncbi:MAG: UDP-N-acetylmuramoylalanyl-D-glutamyl-2,6-diaminopimelate--D-alanyl-D-alanine ligase [Rhodospirillales bacterium]|nr:UDP-N-acetylmuramoylalanyl-D-glutamyl-2,6-diaminopimelate--D-alanyl-D-alanine ligase [Rhodospirillales bacterium]
MSANQILWTSKEAALASGGVSINDWSATGVSIDTRTLMQGDLFVALHGPNFDGNDFVADALAKGAAAAIVDRTVSDEAFKLKVDDTMMALRALARASRERSLATIIAVTGSVGKTGSKEALKFVLSHQGKTSASEGSLNNHWGVPLSLSRMHRDSAYGIFELGMNHPGEINPLSRMVRPHVALITTVEAVHSEFFETDEAIADAKAEIFAGLEPGGAAVLNRDNRHFHRLASAAQAKNVKRIISFGTWDEADFRLLNAIPEKGGTVIQADLGGSQITFRLAIPGEHWIVNSLGVLAVVAAAGGNVAEAAEALGEFQAPKGRGQFHLVHARGGDITLIDESYNASPVSMRAAIGILAQTKPESGGRRIAVLGDMLELGGNASELHAGLADVLVSEGIDLVYTAGRKMLHLTEALVPAMRGGHAINSQLLAPMVLETAAPGDVVMVKGSAGSKMGFIVDSLLGLDENENGSPKRVVNGD